MSPTHLVQKEIERFLTTKTPEVLCVKGDWGIGKTFMWKQLFSAAREKETVALNRYSYVSLFGIRTIEELKYSIFENIDMIRNESRIFQKFLPNFLVKNALRLLKFGRQPATAIPHLGKILEKSGPLFFSSIRNQIVCVDDLERRNSQLSLLDILGLITYLKEEKSCKIILILNDKSLSDDDKRAFDTHSEKAIDTQLSFAPLTKESVKIALDSRIASNKNIADFCKSLNINNIRVIKKIERLKNIIEPMLSEFGPDTTHQALHTLTLLAWCKLQPAEAPGLDFVVNEYQRHNLGLGDEEEIQDTEQRWITILRDYNFMSLDDFDTEIFEGLNRGYFDELKIKSLGKKKTEEINLRNKTDSFSEAWDNFHGSFDDNQEYVLDNIYNSFVQNLETVSMMNADATVRLFRDLDREEQAIKLIDEYVKNRTEARDFWDLSNNPFGDEIKDPEFLCAVQEKFESFASPINPRAVLLKIHTNQSWNSEDMKSLSELSVDDYYRLFKDARGRDLHKIVSGALSFRKIVNATPEMETITEHATEALKIIGAESRLNERRVRKYGINLVAGDSS